MRTIRGAVAVALMVAGLLTTASTAGAAAPVVQQREPGSILLAHRFETPTLGGQERLTISIKPNNDWATETLLDFDRDGQPDAMVAIYTSTPGASTATWIVYRLNGATVVPGLGTDAPPCFIPQPGQNAVNTGITGARPIAIVKTANSWTVTLNAKFDELYGTTGALNAPAYAPEMITMATTAARSVGSSNTVQDYLPDAARPAVPEADTNCFGLARPGVYASGLGVLPDRGTDRGQGTGPAPQRQTMLDRADQGAGMTDLLQADVEQWTAVRPAADVTTDPPGSGVTTTHPTDLVLHFKDRSALASATYLFAGGSTGPTGLVLTDVSDPGRIDVKLELGLTGLTGNRCYPRSWQSPVGAGSTAWGTGEVNFTLPLADDAQGHPAVRIDLDQALGIYAGGFGDTPAFKWVATTTSPGAVDFAPEVAKPSGSTLCSYGTANEPGTVIDPSLAVPMSTSVPAATLTPSNAAPDRAVPITLTAGGGGTTFRFDADGDGVFDPPTASTTVSQPYNAPATARLFVTNGSAANMAETRISPANPLPHALIRPEQPAPYLLGSGPFELRFDDASTDTAGGTIAAHSWKLESSRLSQPIEGHDPVFARTFNPGDQGSYTLTLTTEDNDQGRSTTSITFDVVRPPVAIIDKITPRYGANADTEPGPIIWNSNVGGQFRAWARTAPDGSLGSRGPLTYFFDWGERNADGSPKWWNWTDLGYGDAGFCCIGAFPIRMKAVDADGREAISPTVTVRVRAPNEHPPTARLSLGMQTLPQAGADVLLDASASMFNNPDGTQVPATLFRFDFGDGSDPVETTQAIVHHVYSGSGTHTASVVAIDDRGGFYPRSESDPAELRFRVLTGPGDTNAPQVVVDRLSPAGKVYANRDVQLSAGRSRIVSGPAHFRWDLDGDGTFETDTGDQASLTTRFATTGHRDIRVQVSDAEGRTGVSAPVGLDVLPEPIKLPNAVLTGPDTVTVSNGVATAALDASQSTATNDEPALRFEWDLDGDGIYETDTGADPHATARFTVGGDQVARVRVTDVFGNAAIATKTIFVRGEAEVAAGCKDREQFRTVTYKLIHASGCFVSVPRPNAGPLWIGHGDMTLNGLKLQAGAGRRASDQTFSDCTGACVTAQRLFNDEGQGRRIALDPNDGHLVSNTPVAVKAAGSGVSLTLNDAPLDATLPATKDDDGLMLHPPGGVKLLSLDLASTAEVQFPAVGQATVAMSVSLPPQMPGVGGDVTLRSTDTQGLILDHLKIEVQTGVLSDYLKLGSLSIEYDRPDDEWVGAAELGLPAIKGKEFDLAVEIHIKGGRFKSIYGAVDGLEIDLGEGIFLQRIRAGVGVDPLDLQGGLGISAGPKIAGTQLLSADGDLRVTFPSPTAPFVLFQVAGNTKLLDQIELSHGVVRFATNGFFEGRYGIERTAGIGYFDADLGGWFTFSKANFTGNAHAGILFLGDKIELASAHAVLSTKGIAACGEIPVIKLAGGLGYRWGQSYNTFTGCDLGPYSEDRPAGIPDGFEVRTAAATAPAVTLPAGLRSAGITVSGRGGPPQVKVVDPQGTVVLDATQESLTAKQMVVFDPNTATTSILWKAPPKGRYFVVAAAGSPAIAKVSHAEDAGPQRVRVTVTGPAAKRRLAWTVTPALQRGQEITLGEATALDGAGHDITTTTKSKGSMAFTPQDGHGERRVVTATIVTDGRARPSTVAARFAAPRFVRPAKPRGVTLTRHGREVVVSWQPGDKVAPAGGWRVGLAIGDLRQAQQQIKAGARSATFTDVPAGTAVTATVAGVAANRAPGPVTRATVAAGVARSGAPTGSAAARPRVLTARRRGTTLVVKWAAGAERPRGYTVLVKIGKAAAVRYTAPAGRPSLSVKGLPKRRTAVRVQVRAERFTGQPSPAAVVNAMR